MKRTRTWGNDKNEGMWEIDNEGAWRNDKEKGTQRNEKDKSIYGEITSTNARNSSILKKLSTEVFLCKYF